ncbi:hypothetical protein KSP39_PZI018931 [Platanthera zijinensis]|uniref:Uncharacterized protein n=1 Tax=Platanthera zijinensis TaxID=2320716 RepID=A0AAP0B384_9ASPA
MLFLSWRKLWRFIPRRMTLFGLWEMHKIFFHSSRKILRMPSLILRGQCSASSKHWKRYLYPHGYFSYSFVSFSSKKLKPGFLLVTYVSFVSIIF